MTKLLLLVVSCLYICLTLVSFAPTNVVAELPPEYYDQLKETSTHVLHLTVDTIAFVEQIANVQYYNVDATVKDIVRIPVSSIIAGESKISFITYVTDDTNNTAGPSDPIDIFEGDCIKAYLNQTDGSTDETTFKLGAEGQSLEQLDQGLCAPTDTPSLTPMMMPISTPPIVVPTAPIVVPTAPVVKPTAPVVVPTAPVRKPTGKPVTKPVNSNKSPTGKPVKKPTTKAPVSAPASAPASAPVSPVVVVVVVVPTVNTTTTNGTVPIIVSNVTVPNVTVTTTVAPVPAPVTPPTSSSTTTTTFISYSAIIGVTMIVLFL